MTESAAPRRTALDWVLFPFWNTAERRLRVLWRFAAVGLLMYALLLAAFRLGLPVNGISFQASLVRLLVTAMAVLAVALTLDRRSLRTVGLCIDRAWLVDAGVGIALGAALIAVGVGVLSAVGWMDPDVVESPDLRAWAVMMGTLFCAALFEEVLFRSWILRHLADALDFRVVGTARALWIATLVSSVTFALAHGKNPNVTRFALVNIAAAGIWLAVPYLWTRRLGLSFGLHWGWNAALGPLFGIPVSGEAGMPSLLVSKETGPDEITGGSFGLEGGVTALVLIVLSVLLIAAWVRKRYGKVAVDPALLAR